MVEDMGSVDQVAIVPAVAGSSALLDQVIAHSPIGIAVIDSEGLYVDVNPAYATLYGYARQEMLGQPFTMVFPPEQHARVLAGHQAFLQEGTALKGEFDVLRRDGRLLTILAESTRLPGAQGRPLRLVYVLDITDRRRVELALQASGRFLNSVLDALTAHVCVLDEQGTILAVNQAWRDFATANGAVASQVHEGASYTAVCQSPADAHGPAVEALTAFGVLLAEVLAGQRQHFQMEYPCHSADEQRWFVARVARIPGSDPVRVVVAHDNVSPLILAQETLRRSEAELQDMAASIPGAMFRLRHSAQAFWQFTYFSPGIEALFELTPEQACDDIHALGQCILPADKPAHDASLQRAVAQHLPWEHEYRIQTRSGRVKWVHVLAKPKHGEGGDTVWTGMLADVSQRKQMEAVLKASEDKYRTLFETVPQGVVYQDAQGRITSANPAAQRILGLTIEQLQGLASIDARWQALREDGSDFPGDQQPAMVALRTGVPVKDVLMSVIVPGRGRAWLLVNATPLFRNGELQQVYALFEDITERVLMSRELHHQARTDFLTGVANRRGLMDRMQIELDRVLRHPDVRCSVMSVDLDHFKQVNDTWGHAAGDAVLRHVARLMQQTTRHNDLVARSGGEEFALLLPDTGAEEAQVLGERLRELVAQNPTQQGSEQIAVTVSVGISVIAPADVNLDAVLARADQALYEAKHGGRDAVRAVLPQA